jgi:hypothetical protein
MAKEAWYEERQQTLLTKTGEVLEAVKMLHREAGELRGGLASTAEVSKVESDKTALTQVGGKVQQWEQDLKAALDDLDKIPKPTPSGGNGGKSRPGTTAIVWGLLVSGVGAAIWAILRTQLELQPTYEGYDPKIVLAFAAFGVAASAYLAGAGRDVRKAMATEKDPEQRERHVKDLRFIDAADTVTIVLILVAIGTLLGPYMNGWAVMLGSQEEVDLFLTVMALMTVLSGLALHIRQRFAEHPRI